MQLMGNSRARAVYEANLPDGFTRSFTSDQSLEHFIRTKYEKKKYIAKEYVAQKPPEYPQGWNDLIEAEKMKKDVRKIVLPSHNSSSKNKIESAIKSQQASTESKASPKVNKQQQQQQSQTTTKSTTTTTTTNSTNNTSTTSAEQDLLGLSLGEVSSPSNVDILGIGN